MRQLIIRTWNALVSVFNYVIPQSNKIILVGGWFGKRFADNSKAIFIFLNEYKSELGLDKIIYISNDENIIQDLSKQGYIGYKVNSLKSIYYHLRAQIHIVDQGANDLNKYFSSRASKINLWHGYPLKKIGRMTLTKEQELKSRQMAKYQIGNWQNAYYLSISKEMSRLWNIAFFTDKNHIIEGVYPRNLYLLGDIRKFYLNSERPYIKKIENLIKQKYKILFYLPTFRDNEKINEKCMLDILNLQSFLKEHNIHLITKMHFASKMAECKSETSNIINLPSDADVYNFLNYADVLITDYSSVYFDFLLLNKAIIYYCFDIDYYMNSDRGFVYDYYTFTPGEKAHSLNELKIKIVNALIQNSEDIRVQQKYVKDIVFNQNKITCADLIKTWNDFVNVTNKRLG